MHPPILTIAIPTYNRFETVCANIKLLVPQMSPDVCLLVIDNASTDGTRDLNDWVRANHPDASIRVIRNVTNVGAGANVTRSFELVDTPWVWTLSDDDPVHPDAVDCNQLRFRMRFDGQLTLSSTVAPSPTSPKTWTLCPIFC